MDRRGTRSSPQCVRNDVHRRACRQSCFNAAPRKRSALPITDAELKLIASAAIIGDSSQPVNGYSTPAASGTPIAL